VETLQTGLQVPPFRPRRWLRGGHLQTLASYFLSRRFNLTAPEERLVEVEPGIKVLCHCHWQEKRRKPLTIIIVHGLEGSSDSGYMLGIAEKGLAAGMNVVRVNQRNCGGTDHMAPTLYNSSLSNDLVAIAKNLVEQDEVSQFALVGYSMGGNLVLKAAGEWGADAPHQFRGVAAVCPSMDLAASADALHEPANRLYEKYFLEKLGRRFRAKARLFPDVFDPSRLRGLKSLRHFDDKITAYYCGFAGAADYYARAAASNVVEQIGVPALILHAASDPFIRITQETRGKIAANPNILFVETEDGGHCSFLADPDGYDGNWAERAVVDFLSRI
jgi:predicted alpha/beta-fold hydrolase